MSINTYLVCASPRSGSTLLCESLRDTFEAGRPAEYFDNRPHVDARYKGKFGVDNDADYLDAVIADASTGNGVCGLKVHWHQRLTMERVVRAAHRREALSCPDLSLIDYQSKRFGQVRRIWLRRRDHVAQAVSLYRATRSDFWHLAPGKQAPKELDQLEYSFKDLDYLVHACFRYDTSWGKYFEENQLPVMTVYYEDFVADHRGTLASVLDYLGLHSASKSVVAPPLARLSGRTSREWGDLYRKDKFVWLESADMRAA